MDTRAVLIELFAERPEPALTLISTQDQACVEAICRKLIAFEILGRRELIIVQLDPRSDPDLQTKLNIVGSPDQTPSRLYARR